MPAEAIIIIGLFILIVFVVLVFTAGRRGSPGTSTDRLSREQDFRHDAALGAVVYTQTNLERDTSLERSESAQDFRTSFTSTDANTSRYERDTERADFRDDDRGSNSGGWDSGGSGNDNSSDSGGSGNYGSSDSGSSDSGGGDSGSSND